MTNEYVKSAAAAVALALLNLIAIMGFNIPGPQAAEFSSAFVIIASFFAPRIKYLGHKYAGAIGALVGLALLGLNLLVLRGWNPGETLKASISTLIVAVGALFVPSLTRAPAAAPTP